MARVGGEVQMSEGCRRLKVTWLPAGPCARPDLPSGCFYSDECFGVSGTGGRESWAMRLTSRGLAGSRQAWYHLLPHPGDPAASDTEATKCVCRAAEGRRGARLLRGSRASA